MSFPCLLLGVEICNLIGGHIDVHNAIINKQNHPHSYFWLELVWSNVRLKFSIDLKFPLHIFLVWGWDLKVTLKAYLVRMTCECMENCQFMMKHYHLPSNFWIELVIYGIDGWVLQIVHFDFLTMGVEIC